MQRRPIGFTRRASCALACSLGLVLLACGGSSDATGPNGPPVQDPPPVQNPPPVQQPPTIPENPPPQGGIQGSYALVQINGSQPGQMVTVSNPDGTVIGLYRFDAGTTLTLDPLQTYHLTLSYSDEKGQYGYEDEGEFKSPGQANGTLALVFSSATYGDEFSGISVDGVVAFKYDFDGDGQADTIFTFQRVG